MFQLNDQFLADVGLDALPAGDKSGLLKHVYETLELRVGTRLSEGLSYAQLEEFERIIDREVDVIIEWVEHHAPDFPQDPVYQAMREALSGADDSVILCEFVSTKWLEVNRRDYRDVVAAEVKRLKAELMEAAPGILASCGQSALAQSTSATGW